MFLQRVNGLVLPIFIKLVRHHLPMSLAVLEMVKNCEAASFSGAFHSPKVGRQKKRCHCPLLCRNLKKGFKHSRSCVS